MNNIVNILGIRNYREIDGVASYYYEIMSKYENIEFLYWYLDTNYRNNKNILNNVESIPMILGKNSKNANLISIFITKLKYAFFLRYRLKNKKNEIWLFHLNWKMILFTSKKFFRSNDVYLFQHSVLNMPFFINNFIFKKNIESKMRFCKKVHHYSAYDKKIILKYFPNFQKKLFSYQTIIPSILISKIKNDNRKNDIIFVGRDDPSKRLHIFLDFANKNKNISAIIIGKKVIDIESFAPYSITRKKIFELLNSSKFLFIASTLEGQAQVFWEALSQNTQIIIFSDSPIYDFYRGKTGIYFASTFNEVNMIIKNWKWIDLKHTINDFRKTYSFFHNTYLEKLNEKK